MFGRWLSLPRAGPALLGAWPPVPDSTIPVDRSRSAEVRPCHPRDYSPRQPLLPYGRCVTTLTPPLDSVDNGVPDLERRACRSSTTEPGP
jgi:hypothetical protein